MDSKIEELTIDKEFENWLPKISMEKYEQLEKSLLEEGCRDRIIVWKKGDQKIIVDGHNRYKICSEHNIKYKLLEKEFKNSDEVLDYIFVTQFGKRRLTDKQEKYIIGRQYNKMKKPPHRPKKTLAEKGGEIRPLKTSEKIAEELGYSITYVKDAGKYAENIDTIRDKVGSEPTDKILTGKNKPSVDSVKKIAKLETNDIKEVLEKGENEKINNVLKKMNIKEPISETVKISKKVEKSPPNIHKSNYLKWIPTLDDKSIDLLITQPPNKKEEEAKKKFVEKWIPLTFSKIKDTGSAYIFVSPSYIDIIIYIDVLRDSNLELDFVDIIPWTFKDTSEPIPMHAKRLTWQPILYLKGKNSKTKGIPKIDRQSSVPHIEIPEDSKINPRYTFQKPDKLIKQLIQFSSNEGDIIIDPFASVGKFLITGVELDRKASGCEENDVILKVAENSGCKIIT